jgi:hypothetical protein
MKFLGDHRPKPVHHRYLMNGMPRNCAYCREPLQGEVWRHGEQYFCTELCIENAPVLSRPQQ